jgi:hypothetical protein
MDYAIAGMGYHCIPAKDYIWGQNEHRSMIGLRKKEAATCSLDGAVTASIKLVQNYILTQFILQTPSLAITIAAIKQKSTTSY